MPIKISFEEMKQIIEKALYLLYSKDSYILDRRLKEECINHRLAKHLESIFPFERYRESQDSHHLNLTVDLEYNKMGDDDKATQYEDYGSDKHIRPDIIIHSRGNNFRNILAIEAKKSYVNLYDKYKINKLMSNPYNYQYGCTISYLIDKDYFIYTLFSADRTEKSKLHKRYIY